jgi:hypothetical protein
MYTLAHISILCRVPGYIRHSESLFALLIEICDESVASYLFENSSWLPGNAGDFPCNSGLPTGSCVPLCSTQDRECLPTDSLRTRVSKETDRWRTLDLDAT